jgi:hypothetical protein
MHAILVKFIRWRSKYIFGLIKAFLMMLLSFYKNVDFTKNIHLHSSRSINAQ